MQKTINLPTEYIVSKLYNNVRGVKGKNGNQIYNFSCPICNEGKSKTKRRGYYFVKDDYFYCQNCQKSWSPINWIMEVEGLTFKQVIREANDHDNTFNEIIDKTSNTPTEKPKQCSLPYDSINLSDPIQLHYYKDSKEVQYCLQYINKRRLNTALNKPKAFYLSLTDKTHKNRLCIPFFDANGKIIYYQTRALYERDEALAKYLCKTGGDKSLYGIDHISSDLEYIFKFEGPIDSMFCQNGVAACGLSLSEKQVDQLDKYRLFDQVWILDNQLDNKDVIKKYNEVIDRGEKIFFWPPEFKDFKDFNDICVATEKDSIPTKFILKNTLSGLAAKIKLEEIKHSIAI
jgi:DNA primase